MAITSESKPKRLSQYKSTHFRYALTYVLITFFVLLFLNIYSFQASQALFYKNKETSMIERCHLAAAEIADLEVLNNTTVTGAVTEMGSIKVTRMIVTDHAGIALYDSYTTQSAAGKYVLLPEIVEALSVQDVFSWNYHSGAMESRAATPIVSYGIPVGCVYMMEYDTQQGALIQTLQKNTLIITLLLEIAVVLFSIFFSTSFTKRLRKIMVSMRIIRGGDYSHQVTMGGNDELTLLGDEFNSLMERLQTSEQKRHNFVSDASHELKTPLASIKLLTDSILQNEMDTETIREFVGDIGNEADRLTRMSEKLLSLSRIESQADSDCEIVYLSPTVERVTRMLLGAAEKHHITIESDLTNDRPILIIEDDLYQIVFNLVENSIKYNNDGGTVHISFSSDEENISLHVKDSGTGIPEDAITHIFERFFRVDKARSRKSGGSGLGLSIVRNIVERNRGQIHVDSQVGIGTQFTVTFPIFDVEEESQ